MAFATRRMPDLRRSPELKGWHLRMVLGPSNAHDFGNISSNQEDKEELETCLGEPGCMRCAVAKYSHTIHPNARNVHRFFRTLIDLVLSTAAA